MSCVCNKHIVNREQGHGRADCVPMGEGKPRGAAWVAWEQPEDRLAGQLNGEAQAWCISQTALQAGLLQC